MKAKKAKKLLIGIVPHASITDTRKSVHLGIPMVIFGGKPYKKDRNGRKNKNTSGN